MCPLRILLVTTIAVLKVHEGETLKCWMCDTFTPGVAGCSDPFLGSADFEGDHMFIKECEKTSFLQLLPNGTTTRTQNVNSGLELFCLKLIGKILGTKVVIRDCASGLPNITKGSCMDTEPQRITKEIPILTCDACAGDLCNGAASAGAAAVLAALLLLSLA